MKLNTVLAVSLLVAVGVGFSSGCHHHQDYDEFDQYGEAKRGCRELEAARSNFLAVEKAEYDRRLDELRKQPNPNGYALATAEGTAWMTEDERNCVEWFDRQDYDRDVRQPRQGRQCHVRSERQEREVGHGPRWRKRCHADGQWFVRAGSRRYPGATLRLMSSVLISPLRWPLA